MTVRQRSAVALAAAAVVAATAWTTFVRTPAKPPARNLGAEVRAVFADKCAACHGSAVAKPKGRFGYVDDLRRIADNPEMVVPGEPDQSELLTLVEHDEMPPADAPDGPLSAAERQSIRAWIAAGAPP